MHSFPQVEIRGELVRLIIINRQGFKGKLFLSSLFVFNYCFIESAVGNSLRKNNFIEVELFLDVLILIRLP